MIKFPFHNLFSGLALFFFMYSCSSGEDEVTPEDDREEVEEPTEEEPDDEYAAPAMWQEHWFDHTELVQLVYEDEDLALYYDSDVDRSITWPNTTFSDVWEYVKTVYGSYGEDEKLYAILHTDKYSGGHPSTFMDESHDFRNVVDCGPYTWQDEDPDLGLSMMIHEVGHIVEGATNGIQYNPAWDIWGDSKWAEIFVYDVYKGIGKDDFAQHAYDDFMNTVDDYPRPGTMWFRNWFYPIYSNYGEAALLNNFYDLLADYFPTNSAKNRFSRRMNMGEFIHFWSGAANHDLKEQATIAFGWSSIYEEQLTKAREDFPELDYEYSETPEEDQPVNFALEGNLSVSAENANGEEAQEGSSKLTDGLLSTKFFLRPYSSDFEAILSFEDEITINAYAISSANDFAERDPKSWELLGSLDGENWESIDVQTEVNFEERFQNKIFEFDQDINYSYFKLRIMENAGSTDLQVGEWSLLYINDQNDN
ncbi:discoidin domain-containing protein [Zunongwangia profunda]|jgi:hypothetical protein|uniref:discoidin domain-containing protein n=1 Tax=Zunongwangia profunda TaxID=398743 RepID=UPI001D17D929|nr:discoidin domain-containing protein [Zunongwangia profunda]MCC4228704.1 discoidin domain-containing protein [Zunongwangia profunda]|tara:strand:- start:1149 stop:2585 length:1437 start_codon:yes stop_codon:yes gene_type:complete